MNVIERNVWVLEKEYVKPIEIVQSTDAVPIRITLMDYIIPEGATATVYTEEKSALAPIGGNNDVTFTPEAGFFTKGNGTLQIRITGANQRNLVGFAVPVICYKDALDDAGEVENPTLLSQILAQLGELSTAVAAIVEMTNQEMDIIFGGGSVGSEGGDENPGSDMGTGTSNYNELDNKPAINGVILQGDLGGDDLSLYGTESDMSSSELDEMFTAVFV